MNYVVTGGAGFIGSHIAKYLVDRGHDVTVVDNFFSGKKENFRHLCDNPHFHFVQGTITDPEILKDTFRNADGIFHQVAIPSVPRSIRDPVATNDVEP
jgi:UDP-glucose 4-epimerase